jgi:glycosyltransferase involved in cell wall biosynthesis
MDKNTLDVSIVLAVYNEEESIALEISVIREAMAKSDFTYEIIVVDDASTDGTAEALKNFKAVTVITHRRNKGSGGARKTGTVAARGRIVVWTDADMTYPNHLIPELVRHLADSDFRQVVGNRLSEKGTLKYLRTPAKYLLRKLASFLSKTDIPDLNSGFRAFYRDDALKFLFLVPNGFSCVSTMTLAFLCNDLDIGYMPIVYKKRAGYSKFHPIKDSYGYFLQIIRMITYFAPLRVFMPISISIFLFTLIKHILDLVITKNTQETDIVGYTMAFTIFSTGLLADLIVTSNKKEK